MTILPGSVSHIPHYHQELREKEGDQVTVQEKRHDTSVYSLAKLGQILLSEEFGPQEDFFLRAKQVFAYKLHLSWCHEAFFYFFDLHDKI